MALPKPIRPEYSTTIPSSGKKIKYQPFSVREEKILMLAAESQDKDEISNAVVNVLTNCVTHPSDFKVEELALFDIEFLFLKTRAKSAGELIKVVITDPDDPNFTTTHEINIDKIGVVKTEGHSDLIQIDEETSIKMRYPDISFFAEGLDTSNVENNTKLISRCISQIIVGEEVFNRSDMTDEEVDEWLDGLTMDKYGKFSEFFNTMPKLAHKITLKNTNTGKNFTLELEGLADFF